DPAVKERVARERHRQLVGPEVSPLGRPRTQTLESDPQELEVFLGPGGNDVKAFRRPEVAVHGDGEAADDHELHSGLRERSEEVVKPRNCSGRHVVLLARPTSALPVSLSSTAARNRSAAVVPRYSERSSRAV